MQFTKGSYPKLNEFVDVLRGMQKKEDFDCLIGVSGFKGFGKSTFSIQCSRRYVKKYIGNKFDLSEYTAYSNEDVLKKVENLPKNSPLSCDEAVNFAMSTDWAKAESKRLKKIFTKIRTKHLIIFFNIPDLWWLDKKYRENMMTIWIHIIKKGYVMVSLPNLAPAVEDRWHKSWLLKAFKRKHWHFFSDHEKMVRILRKYPCYYDEFTFPKLPERLYKKHMELREKRMLDDIIETVSKSDEILYKPLYYIYKNKDKVTEQLSKDKITKKDIYRTFLKPHRISSYETMRRKFNIFRESEKHKTQNT